MDQTKALEKIAKEIVTCGICQLGTSGESVPGEGNSNANVVFIGEAPGKEEAKTGSPFIGRSGKLLRKLIAKIGLVDEEIFITSPVKFLPDRGTPTREQIIHGRVHLLEQLSIIKPKLVILLGATACLAVLKRPILITKEHGKTIDQKDITYFITFHPAAAIRFQKHLYALETDFKMLKKLLVRGRLL